MHEPRELLDETVIDHHRLIKSIIEELEAVDWYLQRASATEMPLLKELVLHNAKEEMEHVVLGLELLRKVHPLWAKMFDEHMYNDDFLAEYGDEFDKTPQEFLGGE